MQPDGDFTSPARRYRGDSLVLETDFETATGAARLIDFMPPRGEAPDVVRIVEGTRGKVEMRMELALRFDYGSIVPWVRSRDGSIVGVAGPDAVSLRTPVDLEGRDLRTHAQFTVEEGARVPFVLTWFPSNRDLPSPVDAELALSQTLDYWGEWMRQCTLEGRWSEAVRRSLITLKALTYAPTGGIVAAPTTSLPEAIGGVRNWDYRFCWLRDATLTLLAFVRAGYLDEARQWREWLLRAIAGSPENLQVLYGVAGERRLVEIELPWLGGYEGSKPVRIGNDASNQLQLDVYGEVIDALHTSRRKGLEASDDAWAIARKLFEWLETGWREPDEGIWEVRGPRRHFTHSKVMCWVAFDRAVKAIRKLGREGPLERWVATRDAIKADVLENGFNTEDRRVRPVLRLRPPRRQPAPDSARRVPPGDGRARAGDGGGYPPRPDARRVRRALSRRRRQHRRRRPPPGEGVFLPARSGSSPCSLSRVASTRRSSSTNGCSRSAATSACSRRSTTRRADASSATSRRPSPTSRSSRRRSR